MTLTISLERPHRPAAPRRHRLRSLLGQARAVLSRRVADVRTVAGSKAMANLRSVPLTVIGLGSFDAAFFTWHLFAGLIVLGISCFYLEHIIADE